MTIKRGKQDGLCKKGDELIQDRKKLKEQVRDDEFILEWKGNVDTL